MKINTVNATFQPTKIGTAHGLQINYLKDNSTRNIFVYHEDGKVRRGASLICVLGGGGGRRMQEKACVSLLWKWFVITSQRIIEVYLYDASQ